MPVIALASQVVLHPKVSAALRFLAFTVSRDKTYRSIQYLARFLSWFYLKNGWKDSPEASALGISWNNLKTALSNGRKLMRIGKPLEHAQAAVRALDVNDPVLRTTAFGRQIGYMLYLVYDTLIWLHVSRVRPLSPLNATKVTRRSFHFWTFGLVCSLLSGVYKEPLTAHKIRRAKKAALVDEKSVGVEVKALEAERKKNRTQILQDSLDLLIPISGLGWIDVGDGVVGIAGLITSLMGARAQWEATVGKKA